MRITNIAYSRDFVKQVKKLPAPIFEAALKSELLFKFNPLHPSLRLHSLKGKLAGLWSISITRGYRIIFSREDKSDILFISIGKHDIYKFL